MFLQVNAYETVLQQDPQLESKFLLYVESTLVNIVSKINQFEFTLMGIILKFGKIVEESMPEDYYYISF